MCKPLVKWGCQLWWKLGGGSQFLKELHKGLYKVLVDRKGLTVLAVALLDLGFSLSPSTHSTHPALITFCPNCLFSPNDLLQKIQCRNGTQSLPHRIETPGAGRIHHRSQEQTRELMVTLEMYLSGMQRVLAKNYSKSWNILEEPYKGQEMSL